MAKESLVKYFTAADCSAKQLPPTKRKIATNDKVRIFIGTILVNQVIGQSDLFYLKLLSGVKPDRVSTGLVDVFFNC